MTPLHERAQLLQHILYEDCGIDATLTECTELLICDLIELFRAKRLTRIG